ncbi:uncharacterized protein LOC123566263 [Mercenaria mercenaria]|uniref:uncharacterized protein LOC123566263 n=1 Tax=Mercenaria mercenaria TaxID=6596 RepID=UPI00234F2D92|nr:uncharacterized protein LOC123566263 [Mercenaria mercenaria]
MGHGMRSRRCRIGHASKRKQQIKETVFDIVPETYESERFFSSFLEQFPSLSEPTTCDSDITKDHLTADEHYVVFDGVFQHGPDADIDALIKSKYMLKYTNLKQKCVDLREYAEYSCLSTSKYIRFVQLYGDGVCANPVIKVCITVKKRTFQ